MSVVKNIEEVDKYNNKFEKLGYESNGELGIKGRRFFIKSGEGNKVHHVYVFQYHDKYELLRCIAFRDYLKSNENIRDEYGKLKEYLSKKYPHDIESYIDGKDKFVKEVEEKAIGWYLKNNVEEK